MIRMLVVAALAVGLFGFASGEAFAAKPAKAKKAQKTQTAQMVNGTIKSVDAGKSLLVVETGKKEKAERELVITPKTTFSIKDGKATKEATGKEGLELLKEKVGMTVAVKLDDDKKVVSVTVTTAKKKKT